MKKGVFFKKLMALTLTVLMMVSMIGVSGRKVLAEEEEETSTQVTFEKIDNFGNGMLESRRQPVEEVEEVHDDDEIVRVSIVLEDRSVISAGYSAQSVVYDANARNYRAQLKAEQDKVAERISNEVLGEQLDVVWNITLAGNMISAYVPYGKVDEIRQLVGIKEVILEQRYSPAEDAAGEDLPNMATGSEMVGSHLAWAEGYTGFGSKVAIIDTGLDTDHELFDPEGFDYAVEKNLEDGKDAELMTPADVEAVWDQLNASEFISSPNGVYLNTKVPFAVNYVDKGLDVTHDNDTQGEHGSHVAGIAAANRFVTDDNGGFIRSLDKASAKTQGEAPDAQLIVQKVFGKGGGAYDSDYMVAIEDAMIMGADSVNLSLGSGNPGFVSNATYQNILDEIAQSNTVVSMSAGNAYSWATNSTSPFGALYDEDVSFDTLGSPSSYANSFSVASVDNKGSTGQGIVVGDTVIVYADGSSANNAPMVSIPGDYEYIFIDGFGTADDFRAVADVLEGKVAFCSRGSTSFFEKANAAVENGAIATVIYNNQPGTINMNLTGYNYTAPAVSITQAAGAAVRAQSEAKTTAEGAQYFTGTLTISETPVVQNPGEVTSFTMSSFSSTGVPGNLSMKPEITAPGGNIWSVNGAIPGGKSYESMSGTSMAAPQIAGLAAVFGQYVRENDLEAKTGRTARQLALSLLMSTSVPVWNDDEGMYSLLKQGSGLADVNAAINAKSYITIDSVADSAPASSAASIADGKVKVELGALTDDSFTAEFTLHNFSDEDVEYYFDAQFFTQLVYYGYRFEYTEDLYDLAYEWTVNGEAYAPTDAYKYDFNEDGVANGRDAQYLLEYVTGVVDELNDSDYADFDADGDIDTYDARLAFEELNDANAVVEAGEDMNVTLTVSGLEAALGDYVNGNYIEGFIYATEGESFDGALGVTHSIPVLGFFGDWSAASMYEKGSVLDYQYELEDREPYVDNARYGEYYNSFLIKYPGETSAYLFGGNPMVWDEEYMPERNAMNADSVISGLQFRQIRNAGDSKFAVIKGSKEIFTQPTGPIYSAYYYVNGATWRNTSYTLSLGYAPKELKEGTEFELAFISAPEYYVNDDGSTRWDELGEGTVLSIPVTVDNSVPFIVDVTVDGNTMDVIAHDNQYIAAVALYEEDGTMIDYFGSVKEIRKGEQATFSFDLSGFDEIPDHFLVEVYDYAMNLATYKLNLNEDELAEGLTGLTISPEKAKVIKGGTISFAVQAEPWGANEEVSWESDDESIATVNVNGIVTGVNEGTTTIRAISDVNEQIVAEAEVEVFVIKSTIIGGLQDADGTPLLFTWNTETDTTWIQIGNLDKSLTAMALDWYNDEGQYVYQQDFDGYMHKFDLNTETTVETSAATTGFGIPVEDFDFPYLYNMNNGVHRAFAVSEGYLLYSVDIMDNTFTRGYNLATYLQIYSGASMFVALAWGGTSNGSDVLFALDDAGMLWQFTYTSAGSLSLGYIETDLNLSHQVMEDTTGNSLVLGDDGEFYLAHYNGATSELYQLALDPDQGILVGNRIGDVGQDVWPAALLTVLDNTASGNDGAALPSVPSKIVNSFTTVVTDVKEEVFFEENEAAPVEEATEEAVVETPVEAEVAEEAVEAEADGSLNSVVLEESENSTNTTETMVTVAIKADEYTKNGLISVDVPETAELVSWSTAANHKAWNDRVEGTYKFGFVDEEGFELNETMLILVFSPGSTGTVTIVTGDINEDDEQFVTETVILGPASTEHTVHTYGEPEWTWAEDYSTAEATFTCTLEGHQEVAEAEVEFEIVQGNNGFEVVYTATVEFEGEEYTDTVRVPLTVEVEPEELLLAPEETAELNAKSASPVIWSSSNERVAAVDENGVVTAGRCGTATITATTVQGELTATAEVTVLFRDVRDPEGQWYYDAVYWASDNGVVNGYAGNFWPDEVCTRENVMVMIWRMLGSPEPKTPAQFSDVNTWDYYYKAISWAYENKIAVGYNGKFGVGDTCTKEQTVTFLYRAICLIDGKPNVDTSKGTKFNDLKASDYFYVPALWAEQIGLVNGDGKGGFGVGESCTKCVFSAILYRLDDYRN